MNTKKKLPAHTKGSGNIFADLGIPNAEQHQLKAALVVQLKRLIAERGLSQAAAAKLAEIKQPDLSKLLRGQLKLFQWKSCFVCSQHSTRMWKSR